MTLTLDLSPEVEAALEAMAKQQGRSREALIANTCVYTYGADGLRCHSAVTNGGTTTTTDTILDGTMQVQEQRSNSTYATYDIGARGPECRVDNTSTEPDGQGRTVQKTRWYVYDGLGSVVGEVDPTGHMTASQKYDVYGGVRADGCG